MIQSICEWIATVGKLGKIPGAPGTYGSLAAVLVWLILPHPLNPIIFIAILVILSMIGWYTSARVEASTGRIDPSEVIIDEWVGQWIALIAVPLHWPLIVLAFIGFRLFDIVKPWPIRQLQHLPGGVGIMIDDILAGGAALLLTHLARYWWF